MALFSAASGMSDWVNTFLDKIPPDQFKKDEREGLSTVLNQNFTSVQDLQAAFATKSLRDLFSNEVVEALNVNSLRAGVLLIQLDKAADIIPVTVGVDSTSSTSSTSSTPKADAGGGGGRGAFSGGRGVGMAHGMGDGMGGVGYGRF